MTAIKIPVRVVGTNTRRRDPTPRPSERPPAATRAAAIQEVAEAQEVATAREVAPTREVATTHKVATTHEVAAAQDRLLTEVLSIADNLERALAVAQDSPIRQGVAITHRDVLQLLRRHGLERIDAHQQPFDPQWHEAVDVVPARELGVEPGTVVQVMLPGYRRGEQLFRPARVVVAQ